MQARRSSTTIVTGRKGGREQDALPMTARSAAGLRGAGSAAQDRTTCARVGRVAWRPMTLSLASSLGS